MTLFGTAGIRGDATERVTPELALAVGRAVGADAARGDGVVLARDGRVTGPALLGALEAGVESAGARVYRAGALPTPALAYASRGRWGVMVTASHNPPADNGIKCFADGEEVDRTVEERIERRVTDEVAPARWAEWEGCERIDPLSRYRAAVVEYARGHGASLSGLTVAVDCANGVAGLATPQVLRALGAEVLAIHANVDGHFPGRESKPTAESLTDLRTFVADRSPTDRERDPSDVSPGADGRGDSGGEPTRTVRREIDLAIAHDGDGDRIVILDGDGEIVHEDTIVAILAEHYVRASNAGDPVVVTTPNASSRIDERVLAAGGRVERVRLGALHEGITAARAAGGDETEVVFAAEPWKHVHTSFGPWIDGVASAAVLSRLVADRGLPLLRGPVAERPYEKTEVRCPDERKDAAMERLEASLPEAFPGATVTTEYGIRLDLTDETGADGGGDGSGSERGDESGNTDGNGNGGWVLVRPSGTEPYLRLYVESEAVEAVLDSLRETVEAAVTDATPE